MEMNSFVSLESDFTASNQPFPVIVLSSSFSSVLMSSTFFASSIIGSTLELHNSSFFNISAKPNAIIQEQGSYSFTSKITNCAFNHVYGVYDGVLIPSISFGVRSLANFNSTHISCTRWANKHYANETLKRVILDPSVDKEFTFDSCTWKGIKGDEFGQCIFARTQDHTVLTVDVINCKFQNCTSYDGSGGAIFVTGNVAVTLENTSFYNVNAENENKNKETTAGAVHMISIRSPAIRQCLFSGCDSRDACVVYERKMSQIHQKMVDLNGNYTIRQQSYYSQVRERNNFPIEGNDKKMQTKWNSDKDESFEEVEPVCLQCTFLRCNSQGSGGGLYLKDVEDQALVSECDFSSCKANYGGAINVAVTDTVFSKASKRSFNQNLFCIYMSYFAVNVAYKYGHDVFIVSEADYNDGLKFFSLCKTTKQNEGAVIQTKRSKPEEFLNLTNSFEVAQRVIELYPSAQNSAVCGSSQQQPCQSIFKALAQVASYENVKFSIVSNTEMIVDEMISVYQLELEINGNEGGAIFISPQNFVGYEDCIFDIAHSLFSIRNLTILYPKMKSYPFEQIFYGRDDGSPFSIFVDNIVFKCYNDVHKQNGTFNQFPNPKKQLSTKSYESFCFFSGNHGGFISIIGSAFCDIPSETISSIFEESYNPRITLIDCTFQNITSDEKEPALFNARFYSQRYLIMRNITANLIMSNISSGGFMNVSFAESSELVIENSSFISCSASSYAGALSVATLKGGTIILDQLSFLNNSAKKYRDMRFFAWSLLEVNIQTIFNFVDKTIDGTQIGCFDNFNFLEGISVTDLLSVFINRTIFISSSRGVDFTRCGTFNLPCRSLSYGWTHLKIPSQIVIIDLVYLTQPVTMNGTHIYSPYFAKIPGKIEVSVEYSGSWEYLLILNDTVSVTGINFVLWPMTEKTKNAITVARGASLWDDVIISFSSTTEEQSIDYVIFDIVGGNITFFNLSIKGENTMISGGMFAFGIDANRLQLKNVTIENVRIKHDFISVSPDKFCEKEKMKERVRKNILIWNFSYNKTNVLEVSERSSGNAEEEIFDGRLLRSRESAKVQLEINSSLFTRFICNENFEPYGGCIHWSEKNLDGKDSSTTNEDDEAEEGSELFITNCTFSYNGFSNHLCADETKGGAIYFAFHSPIFPFVLQDVSVFKNKANIGRDIFIKCPNISNKKESEKFGINFRHPLWKVQNSIEAESEEEGKVVDYLAFIAYRNTTIYVSGYDSSAKNCRTEKTSTFSSHSSGNNSLCLNDGYVKQESGWDIFFCGSKDDPCSTVNYAMTHLTSPTPSISQKVLIPSQRIPDFIRKKQIFGDEDKDEHLTLRIVGEPSIFDSVTWKSLSVEGEADGAGLLFEKIGQKANSRQGIKQKANLFEDNEPMDDHVIIKGNCKMNNTNVKISADLPMNCLFFIDDAGTLEVERCAISSLNELMIIPTIFKIEAGTLLCTLMKLNKVLFRSESFFIDCSELVDESKVNVQLNKCSLNNITVNDQKSLILFSATEKSSYESSADKYYSKPTSLLTSDPFSSNLSSLDRAISYSLFYSHFSQSISIQLIDTNISLGSKEPESGFFLSMNGFGNVLIQNCCFLFEKALSLVDNVQKNEANTICTWTSSFVSFIGCSVFVRNTTFRTKQVGAINSENSYLSIDPESLKGNSVELNEFPSVAHNIICKNDDSKEERKGIIELVSSARSSFNSKHAAKNGKSRIFDESNEELPENFWIESNNCSLVGFPDELMASLFTPLPSNVSKAKSGEGYEVTLTGKYLLNCNLLMVLLANQTNAGKFTDELEEIAATDKLSCGNENAVSAIFPLDAVERGDGSDVYVVLKFSTERAFNKDLTTFPLRVSEGNYSSAIDDTMMIIIIAVSAVVVGVGFAVALYFMRKRWRKKMLLTEYEEKKSLLTSINADFQGWMRRKEENTAISSNISDYGTTTKQIDIPSDSQDPFLEE
eukprot:MONOS_14029.1-p1 / transcript=MONOS_14029.1 / gene=MONOS_14029 / organism=Monocercomonoides_exilis_PA203 / gene_product=unspecified product / transcript_product=unspecified product / location=Mono_scaffold00924:13247-19108(+) / protein_length=1954 / sequence_SO=supercontig / SO=protein_coding / is_pseudo=false